jgi:transketolase
MRMLGIPGVFAPTGSEEFLLEYFGLTAPHIRDAARAVLADADRPVPCEPAVAAAEPLGSR